MTSAAAKRLILSAYPPEPESACGPAILLQNPDGSLCQGFPPGYKDPGPRGREDREAGYANPANDFVSLYLRHERLFMGLLVFQMVVDILFIGISVHEANLSILQLFDLYRPAHSSREFIRSLFWFSIGLDSIYFVCYYSLGAVCVITDAFSAYSWFSNLVLLGVMMQVIFAYLNKFNLIVFFLRLAVYVYSQYMSNLSLAVANSL